MTDIAQVALVTGAGAGLGQRLAVLLAERGLAVALVDVSAAGLAATKAAMPEGAGSVSIVADLTAEGAPAAAIAGALAAFGRLDIVVNNAGFGAIEPFLGMTAALWHKTLGVNLVALALMTAAAGEAMRRQGTGGRIVNITSPASRMALPNYTAYAASKAGVDAVTRAAALALAPFGVLVNSVAPGMMDTDMQRSTELDLARLEGRADVEAFLDERTRRVPLGRRAAIDEVAAGVLWLALDAPPYVTAERLNLSGGLDRD